MDKMQKTFENFPKRIIALSNLLSVAINTIGIYIVSFIGAELAWLYLGFIILMELNLLKSSCTKCYYYGKLCGFGRSKTCSIIFKKGDPKKFAQREISLKSVLPDIMMMLIPIISAIGLLITKFSWTVLVLLIGYLALSTFGNGFVRGKCTCNHCRQRELGCPAAKMFEALAAATA